LAFNPETVADCSMADRFGAKFSKRRSADTADDLENKSKVAHACRTFA